MISKSNKFFIQYTKWPNEPSKFRSINWFGINIYARRTYNTNSHIKFKTSLLKLRLCDYGDVYVLVKGTISIEPVPPLVTNPNNNDKEVIFRNCAPFIDCINEINNTQIDNAKDIDILMPMCNLIE